MNKYLSFLLLGLIWLPLPVAGGEPETLPVIAVYYRPEEYAMFDSNLQKNRPEPFLQAWQKKFSVRTLGWESFLKEYPRLPTESSTAREIQFFFFSTDGVLLMSKIYTADRLPDMELFSRIGELHGDYRVFMEKNKTSRAKLFWPLQAYRSNQYEISLQMLKKLKENELTDEEKKVAELLRQLNRHWLKLN